jgi:hypothetical protein
MTRFLTVTESSSLTWLACLTTVYQYVEKKKSHTISQTKKLLYFKESELFAFMLLSEFPATTDLTTRPDRTSFQGGKLKIAQAQTPTGTISPQSQSTEFPISCFC